MFICDVCVIGGGPAGSTFAARMAKFGHCVCLIERAAFPRSHLGESLSPGVLPLLETIEARDAIETSGFRCVHAVRLKWDQGLQYRLDPRGEGLLVDRGRFDALLLNRVKHLGVQVLQPATVQERRWDDEGWHFQIETRQGTVELRAKFLADASGRTPALPGRMRRTGCRTVALYAYWRGQHLPDEPWIEAGAEAWYWGVPLPDGSYNTLAFIDVEQFRKGPRASLAARFHELIARSELMAGCPDARLASPVFAADATPYVDDACVTSSSIKVGDAVLAVDPLSSSGVQKAIQNALAGAAVANTLLRKPESSVAALRFFRESVSAASNSHCGWAAEHYLKVAQCGGGRFWQDRAARAVHVPPRAAHEKLPDQPLRPNAAVQVSPELKFVELPCIEGEFVTIKTALRHPNLDRPVAFLGGCEIAPLVKRVNGAPTPSQVASLWSGRVPVETGLNLVRWLVGRGILTQ